MFTIKTSKNKYKFIEPNKVIEKIFFFLTLVLASYGLIELILKANNL